jgi:hypothetical protein
MGESIESIITLMTENKMWQAFFVAVSTFITIKLITQMATTVISYVSVKFDSIGIGTPVEYKGTKAVIKSIGFTRIILENDDKIIFIRIEDWRKIELVMQKDVGRRNDQSKS